MNDPHETESEHTESTRSSKRFYNNPVFGFVGSVAGVIGLVLFLISRTSPDLVYYVDPTRATVVRANQSSRIRVEIDGKDVKRTVTAAQIIIWNDGEESIRRQNLLSPLVIETGRLNPIIEADIREVTREVIGLQLDTSKTNEGQLVVDWTILEQGDGVALQLLYYGDDQTLITASATVEQQGDIRERKDEDERMNWIVLLVFMTGGLLAIIAIGLKLFVRLFRVRNSLQRIVDSEGFLPVLRLIYNVLLLLCVIVVLYYVWTKPNPPINVTGF